MKILTITSLICKFPLIKHYTVYTVSFIFGFSPSPFIFLFSHYFVAQAMTNDRIFAYPPRVEVILKT
jgi:hypothetical protein